MSAEPVVPAGIYEQPEYTVTNEGGARSVTRTFRGLHADLVSFANSYAIGSTTHDGLPLSSVRLTREPGESAAQAGTLTLTFSKAEQGQGGSASATELSTTWQMRHTQKMVSIYRYCGDSLGASANRGRIEQWRKGTDAFLFQNFQWRDKVGAVQTLTGRDQLLAAKFRAGFETVMRFYPTIMKTTQYSHGKISNIGAGLATIVTAGSIGAPTGWTDAAAAWMKIGDDLSFDASSGKQTRTETWLGEESFDKNFYGTGSDRWDWGTI